MLISYERVVWIPRTNSNNQPSGRDCDGADMSNFQEDVSYRLAVEVDIPATS